MKNMNSWVPTKYVRSGSNWVASRDPKQLLPASRLAADSFVIRYAEAIETFAHGRLLDHGAGQSPLFGMYRDKVEEIIAVDWNNSLHNTSYVDIECDLNKKMPFGDESFDTIISSDVVAHLFNPINIMDDLARILRPNGAIILGTPFNYWMNEEPYDYFRWSKYAIVRLAENSGLKVAKLWQCGGTSDVMSDVFLKGMQGKISWAVPLVDSFLRLIKVARPNRVGRAAFTLGTVAVLTK